MRIKNRTSWVGNFLARVQEGTKPGVLEETDARTHGHTVAER